MMDNILLEKEIEECGGLCVYQCIHFPEPEKDSTFSPDKKNYLPSSVKVYV